MMSSQQSETPSFYPAPESSVRPIRPTSVPELQPRLYLPQASALWGNALTIDTVTYPSVDIAEAVKRDSIWGRFISDVIEPCYVGCSAEERERVIKLAKNADIMGMACTWLPGGDERSVIGCMAYLLSLWHVDDLIEQYQSSDPALLEAMVAAWRDMPMVVDIEWKLAGKNATAEELIAAAFHSYGEYEDERVNANIRLCATSSAYARAACASDVVYQRYAETSAAFIEHQIEVSMQAEEGPQNVRELIDRRIVDSGVAPTVWNLIAVSGMSELDGFSEELCDHPRFVEAMNQTCAHIGMMNDVFSYEREILEDSDAQINFVDYARHHLVEGYSLSAAVECTFTETNCCMQKFVSAALDIEECFGEAGRFAVRAMLRAILGNINWSLSAPRYSMKDVVRTAIAVETALAA